MLYRQEQKDETIYFRFMVIDLPAMATDLIDSGIVLASVIMDGANPKMEDEFFFLGQEMSRDTDQATGQNMGFYAMVTKGIGDGRLVEVVDKKRGLTDLSLRYTDNFTS